MKRILFLSLLFCINILANALNVFVDENRFLDKNGNTILEINYQCKYTELLFIKEEEGFVAKLGIEFSITKNDSLIYTDEFTNKIISKTQQLEQTEKAFSDKLSLTLSKSDFNFKIIFYDLNSEKQSEWIHKFKLLPQNSILSDLEFCTNITDATKNSVFDRNKNNFKVNSNHIFDINHDFFYLYFETYSPSAEKKITIKKNNIIVYETFTKITQKEQIERIDISEFTEGYYQIFISLFDGENYGLREDYFSLKKKKEQIVRTFTSFTDEFLLISYFTKSSNRKVWNTLTNDGKSHFIQRFWHNLDLDPTTKNNEFLEKIKLRIADANLKFSSHKKGWKTDRGRIFIKYGTPDDVIKMDTGLYTKYTQKDFEIWKYRNEHFLTYIFIDFMMNGNFTMIYADGDDFEITNPKWKKYLGEDFDTGLLD